MTSTNVQPMSASGPDAEPFETIDPFTGRTLGEFPYLETEQLDALLERASDAYRAWRDTPVTERARVVADAARLMRERKDDLSRLITSEMGKRISESEWEVDLAASILQYYGENGPEILRPTTLDVDEGEAQIVNAPIGVLLGVEPWNFPLYQVVRFAAPNLVLGNTILLKHAKSCALTALEIQRIFTDAGVPEGVYNNIFLRIGDIEHVLAHPAVQGVSLTGSDAAGASVAEIAGRHVKKCVLELGGSDPFIVLDADDLDGTLDAATTGRLANTGQSCVAAKRFIVPERFYDTFVSGLAERFGALRAGDPSDPETTLGPLSSVGAADDLLEQVRDARDKGANVVVGGDRPDVSAPGRREAFVDATVLTDVTPRMRAYTEELFGPVAVVYRVADEDEAIDLANNTKFGLGATVFSSDPERARAVAERIDSGMVWINSPTSTQADLPFGGVKQSGFGRELAELGMFGFANRKLIRTAPRIS
ncbi:putative succinate-semialdehyde dehydrogenase [Nocardia nova SH22a]|uniref:Putative succinate-semialdehyde dehydrogenase n=1 Tax=Nocardia nova SH22a TaxID=1415166 RepID=W5TS91_9NOCA|nr:NAD-dependent succinate-semialdehyde dehydrogenase [Nocardia nova]AHH22250.1 putative succinate-semialdehyde dehydrogenase [Nocardia nova SH22a]